MGQGVREMKTRGAGELEPVQYSKGLLLGAARFHVATRSAPPRCAPFPLAAELRSVLRRQNAPMNVYNTRGINDSCCVGSAQRRCCYRKALRGS